MLEQLPPMTCLLLFLHLLLFVLLASSTATRGAGPRFKVDVDWNANQPPTLKTVPTCQVVVNPLTTRSSPIHKAVHKALASLGASMVRFVPWLPYPRLAVAALEPPSGDRLCGFRNQEGRDFPLELSCGGAGGGGDGGSIAAIEFASFGTPQGFCRGLSLGSCHVKESEEVVRAACLGKTSCKLVPDLSFFQPNSSATAPDPCPGTPKRLAVQVRCSGGGGRFTSWDFTQLDPLMEDFMAAQAGRSVIINFSTPPNWLYKALRSLYPDNPLGLMWNYEQGNQLVEQTAHQFGDYYGRLLAWYTDGGFVDEQGGRHVSGHFYNISMWECLNEPEAEHSNTPASYTLLYDAMVAGMRRFAPSGTRDLQWMGMALALHREWQWYEHFLNASNHVPGTPLDWISFHFYAQPLSRTDPVAYRKFFPDADDFVEEVKVVMALRDKLAPRVMLDVNECGVILTDDNTAGAPLFPLVYWNAAASMYAYLYGRLSLLGLDVLGESQLVGYPQLTLPDGIVLEPQYPSVSMLNWTTGEGNARYWVLKLLIDNTNPGSDRIMPTTVTPIASNPFCGEVLENDTMTLTCPQSKITKIITVGYGNQTGDCPDYTIGSCNSEKARLLVESFCLNQESCSVFFGPSDLGDPCNDNVVKRGIVVAECSGSAGGFSPSSAGIYAQAYQAPDGTRKLLVVNTAGEPKDVNLPGAIGATWKVVDEPLKPPATLVLSTDTWTLKPWSVGFVHL